MKANLYIYIISVILCISVGSCKKSAPLVLPTVNTEEPDTCYCKPLQEPGATLGCPECNTDLDETYFGSPIINPINADELIYLDGVYPNSKISFYNLQTHEKRALINENVERNFSWSRKDWILFQRSADFNLYKIKSNGDSLTQLTYGGKWFHGRWNYEGTKFIVYQKFNSISKSFIMNEQGVVIDSLTNWKHRGGYWSHPLYYLGGSIFEIIVMDIENKMVIKKLSFEKEIDLVGWVSLEEFMYRQATKLYLYNITTSQTKLIKCHCNTSYQTNTCSSDFSKLLFVKIVDSLQTNNRIFEDSKLIFMNKDGTGEFEIIP